MAKPSLPESRTPEFPQPDRIKSRSWKGLSARDTFASLRHPNYRLWFAGQMFSLMGTWMQTTAQGYLIYELTGSPAYLGYVGFAAGIPSWLFTLYGGVIADRMSRRDMLVITQTAMMILAFALAGLAFAGVVQPWHILGLAFLLGIANAFDAPARQAFVLEMVPREDMTNAIALNSTIFNSATAIGPAIGGLVYAAFGPALCFTFNGVSFIAVIAALLLMKIKPFARADRASTALADAAAGFRYVRKNLIARTVITNLAVVSLFGFSFVSLMPAWAVDVLGGDATTNGFLLSGRGVGALVGGLMLASIGGYVVRGRLVMLGSFVMPLTLLLFAGMRWLPLSIITIALTGWSFLIFVNSANALLQSQVPDELRGRVMSIFTLAFFGLMPIGSLLAGSAAEVIGEPMTVAIGASIPLLFALFIWARVPELRRAG